jgi:hypothetical protein
LSRRRLRRSRCSRTRQWRPAARGVRTSIDSTPVAAAGTERGSAERTCEATRIACSVNVVVTRTFDNIAVAPDAYDGFAEVFAGGSKSGNIVLTVPAVEVATVVLYASASFSGDGVYFATQWIHARPVGQAENSTNAGNPAVAHAAGEDLGRDCRRACRRAPYAWCSEPHMLAASTQPPVFSGRGEAPR